MNDTEYNAIKAEIVQLQNENYADPEAADLQARLGDMVLQEYYDSLPFIDGEVVEEGLVVFCPESETIEGENE